MRIFDSVAEHARRGGRKYTSLVPIYGKWGALRRVWSNVFLAEVVVRMEKDLATPDEPVVAKLPLDVLIFDSNNFSETWKGGETLLSTRGSYGLEQFQERIRRGDCLFWAVSEGKAAGFEWLELPPVVDAGYPFQPNQAYTFDAWTFEEFRGKRVLPVILHHIFKYLRSAHPEINTSITHVARWNQASLSSHLRSGYQMARLEWSLVIMGYHHKFVMPKQLYES